MSIGFGLFPVKLFRSMAARKKIPIKPVLIIQHAPHEHPAALRRALYTQGIPTRWIHPYRGQAYPSAQEIGGFVSLGGPMSANDGAEHPWIEQECQLMLRCIEAELPSVGICLGAQMMARALGAVVERNEALELGWFPIELNTEGLSDPILSGAGPTPTVYHWHEDTFQLPAGAQLLARSLACPRQAYKLGEKTYGFQFHPEADHQLVLEWLGIEGVHEEILEIQNRHGSKTVQSSHAQRGHALKEERCSLKITAAIGSLFRNAEPPAMSSPQESRHQLLLDKIQRAITGKNLVQISFMGPDQSQEVLEGQALTLLLLKIGDVLIFQDRDALLWPIRLDDLLSLQPISDRI